MNNSKAAWLNVLTVAGFGVIGAWARWGLGVWGGHLTTSFHLGTLLANLIGCFAMGYVATKWQPTKAGQVRFKLGITTGMLGAFTTYSAFAVEGEHWLQHGDYAAFAAHLVAHVGGGLLCLWIGKEVAAR
jgi:CrcB protein